MSVSANGHLNIPEGTITIVSGSWEEWGVDKTTVKTVTFPATVTNIGENAFRGCILLVTVTIPDSVTSIEDYAFHKCSSLVTLTIPGSVTSIGPFAFYRCILLVTVTIPEGVTCIRYCAFADCFSLKTVTIQGDFTKIGDWAFEECSSLTTLTIPDSVTSIGYRAFYRCGELHTLLIQPAAAATGTDRANALELNKIPLANVTRIWAPDHVINRFTGPFTDYATLAEVPRAMRAVPDATTWAAVQLYLWWSDPQDDAGKGRVLSPSRRQMVWTVMHVAFRLETTSTSPDFADVLPSEMWMLIMTFVKHV
jgi:hypothetical protein